MAELRLFKVIKCSNIELKKVVDKSYFYEYTILCCEGQ